jgi:hypothetical protein
VPEVAVGHVIVPDADVGAAYRQDHLWALMVGNSSTNGNTVYCTAGLDCEQHGLFGSLTLVARGTPEGLAEAASATPCTRST